MTTSKTLLALAIAAASLPVHAQWAPTAPFADEPTSTSSYWNGALSRAEVVNELFEARRSGILLTGHDTPDYPMLIKVTPPAMASTHDTSVLGGAGSDGLTIDGYRFVGGEAGYLQR